MRRRWQIVIGLGVVLAAVLAVNAAVVGNESRGASTTAEDAELVELPGGELQVIDEGPTEVAPDRAGLPIVLIHCYSCSLHWFDRLAPLLVERHRVVRVDLLGHGGSEKPPSGYSIPGQAALVAGALNQLGVQGATVVGHSMGFAVTVALAEQASQLVDRMVNIGAGPSPDFCSIPFAARLAYAPVLGEALWRVTPDVAIESGYSSVFAPGFEAADGFPNPDQIVDDYRAMTFTSFERARAANDDYRDEIPLDARSRAAAVPLMSLFGAEDEICDPISSQAAYESVPGTRVETIDGAGHSPNVERPERTAELIERFARAGGGPGPSD